MSKPRIAKGRLNAITCANNPHTSREVRQLALDLQDKTAEVDALARFRDLRTRHNDELQLRTTQLANTEKLLDEPWRCNRCQRPDLKVKHAVAHGPCPSRTPAEEATLLELWAVQDERDALKEQIAELRHRIEGL